MFSKIYLLAFILVIAFPLCVFGQTIKGRILDFQTKKGISNCSVYILNKPVGVVSNPNGYFLLHGIDKDDTLIISSLGYQTWRGSATIPFKKDSGIFYLKRRTKLLPTVVVNSLPPEKLVQLCLKKSYHALIKRVILKTYCREYIKINDTIKKFSDGIVDFFINGSPKHIELQVQASRSVSELPNSISKKRKKFYVGVDIQRFIRNYFTILTSEPAKSDSFKYEYLKLNFSIPYFAIKSTRETGMNSIISNTWYFNKSDSLLRKLVVSFPKTEKAKSKSISVVPERAKATAIFRSIHDRLYLYYMRGSISGNIYLNKLNEKKSSIEVVSELMVNDIDTKHFHKLPRRLRYTNDHLYENGTHFTTPFWKTENIIATTPEEKAFMSKIDNSYSSNK